ncbi:OmpA family protein (plasmid) [Pseudomonas sp. Leaf58]|uniref:OmpA family protein n=1 Tax=Pseudomonas sp. Leaf58 TaxID=1736226 RepID=UPI0006F8408C|nr:OmpA family protein [Pseudomonas sp. Leaf58]AYG47884.1 OmpA family protein [Pseudomonas sp. Leaf58]KQN62553.1 cell envelope biogenesis protein OmpA [Pseudomonas sp. Leaf58]
MKTAFRLIAASTIAAMLSGCALDGMNKMTTYGGVGALAGAAAGALIGGDGNRGKGALIGAVLAGGAGAGYGYYADKQEAELRKQLAGTGVDIQREGDSIKLIMPGNVTFKTNSSDIASNFYSPLNQVSASLKQYDQTTVSVVGYTDNTGPRQYNMNLSQQRAQNVAQHIISQGVGGHRLMIHGAGPDQPVASNSTEGGRLQNRRVEISLRPVVAAGA